MTTTPPISTLVDDYLRWLKDRTAIREIRDWVEITTPYLDRHNDYLQIYAKQTGTGFRLTDDGYIITDLEQSGFSFDTPKRKELLRMTLNGLGIQREGDALVVNCTADNFPVRKHCLLQAMLTVNDLFSLSSPSSAGDLFYDEVVTWLDDNNIRYLPKPKFAGKTGYDHMFDFAIPKSRTEPERIVKTINRPSRDTAQSTVLAWVDTREVRPPDAKAYALLNNEERVPPTVLEALSSYDVRPVLWSERNKYLDELAA